MTGIVRKIAVPSVLALLAVFVMSGSALAQTQGSTGAWNNNQTAAETNGKTNVLVDPGKIYNDKNPTEWVGKSVELKNVTVQDTNDTGNFWVGSDGGHRLLVVKAENDPNLQAMRFHKGDIVSVTGVVHPASRYMAQQTSASSGSMNDALGSSGVFVLAQQISVSSSTSR